MAKTLRMPPLKDGELNPDQEAIIAPFRAVNADFNVSRIMARHPPMLAAFRTWATYVMIDKNALAEREREIVAMRTAWNIKADYVWSRHIWYADRAGLTREEQAMLKRPLADHTWGAADSALIRAADSLTSTFNLTDEIWADLKGHFEEEQIIDAITCCGHFCLLGMFLNSAGAPLDADVPHDPDFD